MEEKTPPAAAQDTAEKPDLNKELEQLKKDKEETEKRLKDKEAMIGRQSTEIGELRKFRDEHKDLIEKIQSSKPAGKDELVDELKDELIKEGYDEDTANQNARILARSGKTVVQRELNKRMMNDVVDLLDEAFEDGKLDQKVYSEHQEDILKEFRGRVLAQTPRQNFKILKDCYQVVLQKKADEIKKHSKPKDEKDREEMLPGGSATPGGKKPQTDDDFVDSIEKAGSSNSRFA